MGTRLKYLWIPHSFHEVFPNILDNDFSPSCRIGNSFPPSWFRSILVWFDPALALLFMLLVLLIDLPISIFLILVEALDKLLNIWDWISPRVGLSAALLLSHSGCLAERYVGLEDRKVILWTHQFFITLPRLNKSRPRKMESE
jgi:hypothetical protein